MECINREFLRVVYHLKANVTLIIVLSLYSNKCGPKSGASLPEYL